MAENEVVFQQAVEGLFEHGIPKRLTPALVLRVRELGVDLDGKLDPAYPRATWNAVLAAVRTHAFGDLSEDEAYFQIGRSVVIGYSETLVGRALVGVARLMGPRRMLARMTRNLRSASNYNETRYVDAPDGSVEIWINEAQLHPRYVAGLLYAAVEIAGGKGIEVALSDRDAQGCTYKVRWQ